MRRSLVVGTLLLLTISLLGFPSVANAAATAGAVNSGIPFNEIGPFPGPLLPLGGPVQTKPKIYIDFWGWSSDPAGVKPYLKRFFSSVGGSAWLRILSQYGAGVDLKLAGRWDDNSAPVPAEPSSAEIYNEAVAAIVHFGLTTTTQAQIVVALPDGSGLTNAAPGPVVTTARSCLPHQLSSHCRTYLEIPLIQIWRCARQQIRVHHLPWKALLQGMKSLSPSRTLEFRKPVPKMPRGLTQTEERSRTSVSSTIWDQPS